MNDDLTSLRAHARELLERLPGYPADAIRHLDAGDTPDAMHSLLVLRGVVRGQADAAALEQVDAALDALMRVRVAERVVSGA